MSSKKRTVCGKAGKSVRLLLAHARDRPFKKDGIRKIFTEEWDWCCGKISEMDWKKLLSQNSPYFLCGYFGDKVSCLYRSVDNEDIFFRIMLTVEKLDAVFANPLPSLQMHDLIFGIACGGVLKMAVYVKKKNAKKFRNGVEYGSAR